jgi:hypothetical protein
LKLLRTVYTRQSTGLSLRGQFFAAIILGLAFSPAPVLA